MKAREVEVGDSIKLKGVWCKVLKIEHANKGQTVIIHVRDPKGKKDTVRKAAGATVDVE